MSLRRRYKTTACQLSRVKNLFEAYDNVAVMTTVDPRGGLFELVFPEEMKEEVRSIMRGIGEEVKVEEV